MFSASLALVPMRPLLFALACLPAFALAQPAGSGILAGGGPASDTGEAVAVARYTGHTAVVGTFEQTATFGPGVSVTSADAPTSRSDAFVVLYAPDGTALWARRMGTGVFNDFGAGVALGPGTGWFGPPSRVYVSGYFTGIATWDGGANPDISLTTRNDFDAFLAAYDGDGNLLWVEQAGGPGQDTGRGVGVDDGGGAVYWTGSFSGTATWGSGAAAQTRTSAGSSDGFLASYTPDGTLEWVTTVGGPEGDDLRDVAVSPFGYVYATGTFRSVALFGAIPLSSRGLSDVAVIGANAFGGNVVWARQIGGNGNDYARGIAWSFDDRLGVAGSFENVMLVGTDVLTSAGASDAFLAVLTGDGTEVGGHRAGGAGFDIANAVAAVQPVDTPTRAVAPFLPAFALVGYVDGPSTFGTTPVAAQGVDGFAAVYLSSPDAVTFEAAYRIGGTNADRAYGAAIGGLSGFDFTFPLRVTGSFRDAATFGGQTVTSAGSNDVFVATVPLCPTFTCPVWTEAEPGPETAVRLHAAPNPSPARLALTLGTPASSARVEVVDVLGRRVAGLHDGALASGEASWSAPGLAPGAYWLVARVDGAVHRAPFTVAR